MATWDLTETKHHIILCNGGNCSKAGAEQLTQAIRQEIASRDLDREIHTTRTLCNGRCKDQCVAIVYPEGIWYKHLQPEDAASFIRSFYDGTNELAEKVAFSWRNGHFERTEGTVVGLKREREKVAEVSKKFPVNEKTD